VFDISVQHGPDDLRALAKRIRKAGNAKTIRKQLNAGLKEGVKPALAATKKAALDLPVKTGKRETTGLRKKMARVANIQVRSSGRDPGVRVRISRARMGDQASLVKATNNGKWRHPVRGNREVWVTQTSRAGWFDNANRYTGPPVRRAIKRVMDDIEKQLNRQ
jgi:hypothetical protein